MNTNKPKTYFKAFLKSKGVTITTFAQLINTTRQQGTNITAAPEQSIKLKHIEALANHLNTKPHFIIKELNVFKKNYLKLFPD